MSPTKVVDPVVVTATKLETPAQQLGASVSVIDGEDFQTTTIRPWTTRCATVPGVEIRRSGSFGQDHQHLDPRRPIPARCRCWWTACGEESHAGQAS